MGVFFAIVTFLTSLGLLAHFDPSVGGMQLELHARSFPGNVRELENTIEQAVALSSGGLIESLDADTAASTAEAALGLRERVEAFERGLIVQQLNRCGGNRSEAARQLGIGRVTLLDKLRKHGL